jgi:hypothetical protein
LLILLEDKTTERDKADSLGYNLATILVHFPALFFRQFAFCVALIFLLAAALIFRCHLFRTTSAMSPSNSAAPPQALPAIPRLGTGSVSANDYRAVDYSRPDRDSERIVMALFPQRKRISRRCLKSISTTANSLRMSSPMMPSIFCPTALEISGRSSIAKNS